MLPGMVSMLKPNDIISYRELCIIEGQEQLQRGMNFNLGGSYSVVLMSVKPNAPYSDKISADGLTVYYEGHDAAGDKLKKENQPATLPSGVLTQNGLFKAAVDGSKYSDVHLVRIYEKIQKGIWSYRGLFELKQYKYIKRGDRNVFEFILTITEQDLIFAQKHRENRIIDIEQTRQIPGRIKLEVYKRDKGECVRCASKENLHFDHILPFSKGGTSLKVENIQLLCARHNLRKSAKLDG